MPRNKKNKGNSGSAPAPNNNKAKSPAETKNIEIPVASVPVAAPVEAETVNDDLKLRLANAKERLHILQEVIGGIGDPTDVEKLKASGIDAAKEKLNIIQDSVNSVKTTLLEVRQETARSVTPEGSQSGTSKKRKNKKHQNQNPPQGFVAHEQPVTDESKSKPDASENEGSAQEDGTTTLSKKKRNRNRNKNKQNSASESLSQESNVAEKTDTAKVVEQQLEKKETAPPSQTKPPTKEETKAQPKAQTKENSPQAQSKPETKENSPQATPKSDSKENTPEANKSKNNKKNNKKGQQKSNNEKIDTVDAEVKPTDPIDTRSVEAKSADPDTTPTVEVKPTIQPPSNNKNKNKNKNKNAAAGSNVTEKSNEPTEVQENKSTTQGDSDATESKTDDSTATNNKKATNLTKEDALPQKDNQKKNVKDQQPKEKNNEKKGPSVEEITTVATEPIEIPKTAAAETVAEPSNEDSHKNKKDKKKGPAPENKQLSTKVEAPKDEAITIDSQPAKVDAPKVEKDKSQSQTAKPEDKNDTQPPKVDAPKVEKDKNQSQTAKPEDKVDKNSVASTSPVAEKKVSDCSPPQSQKNKKNKQNVPKSEEKPAETATSEKTPDLATEKAASEQSLLPVSKETIQVLGQNTADAINPTSSEKKLPVKVVVPPTVQREPETVVDNKKEILKVTESPKPAFAEDLTSKTESIIAPSLPKLDFSQVVKDNKDKIPLMEIKASPVLAAEIVAENKATNEIEPTDSVIKSVSAEDVTIPTSSASKSEVVSKLVEGIPSKSTSDITSTPTPLSVSKPASDDIKVPDTVEPKVNLPTEVEIGSGKAKTPERKGNQANVKNEQKKPQQGKGQTAKQKQNDPKPQASKKEEAKEVTKVETEAPEPAATPKSVPGKVETKSDSPSAPSTEEKKSKEELTKKNENIKKEQVKQKPDEKKSETKTGPQSDPKDKEAAQVKTDTAEKKLPINQDKADKNANKKSPVVDTKAKQESSSTQPQKQESKTEMSKKDQKKQNKMKGKAPQPPDIPMDMSLLSASMIDPLTTDEAISHEESEDQSSLITSDSKNVAGSDFVQSVEVTTDAAKSLEPIPMTPQEEVKVTEIERKAKSSSPSSSKRNKDMANLKESVEMQEAKRQELPEKSAQQKMEPVQFPPVQLMDILEAKMTSPAVKPGNVAGNVRKLPKDSKRADQLNVQQQKSRSKSPKENAAEKYVKNQKMVSGDNKKQATQNLKNEILKTEVGALVTSVNKDREVKEPTKIDAKDLKEPNVTSGTVSTTSASTDEAEQVGDLKRESDAISKQKAEPLPKNATTPDAKLQPSSDDGKTETKPKIAPKPNVPSKGAPPKVADRSKKSPVKTPENKAPGKDSPTKETVTPPKAAVQTKPNPPVQAKPSPQPKSPTKPTPPTKPQLQTKTSPQTTTVSPPKSPPRSGQPAKKPEVPPKPNLPKPSPNKVPPTPIQDEDEEFVEYKFTPRPVFIATACQICKVPLDIPNPCKLCQMVSYCSDEHEKEDQASHGPLCTAIQEIAKKRGGHIYNNARILNDDDYRSLRVHTLNLCENFLKRHLMPFEREILLFPRLCCKGSCREWRQQSLIECKQCGQVSFCEAHPEHLPQNHEQWCNSFNLYQKIVLRQKNFGRIEPSLPSKIMLKPFDLSNSIDNVFKILYKNYGAIKDECIYATLTQLATAPLTALYGAQINRQEIGEVYTIHLVGAELQFEADTLDKWETFFLHLIPTLVECRVVFVGPELNAENLPLEVLSRIRMCRTCRQNCRIVKFDFQCGILYHDYVASSVFTKPDLICFFNPGLYRSTGFNGLDTWPNTIKSATSMNCPIVVTSYTEIESPRDLERIQKESDRPLSVVQLPQINPFASQRPERNFISDEVAPMIFKNFFCFCVK